MTSLSWSILSGFCVVFSKCKKIRSGKIVRVYSSRSHHHHQPCPDSPIRLRCRDDRAKRTNVLHPSLAFVRDIASGNSSPRSLMSSRTPSPFCPRSTSVPQSLLCSAGYGSSKHKFKYRPMLVLSLMDCHECENIYNGC